MVIIRMATSAAGSKHLFSLWLSNCSIAKIEPKKEKMKARSNDKTDVRTTESVKDDGSPNLSNVVCPVRERVIEEAKDKNKGEDAIFYEGLSQAWLYRCCAGLSNKRFTTLSSSQEVFLCSACKGDLLSETVSKLKGTVEELTSEDEELKRVVFSCRSTISDNRQSGCELSLFYL